MSENRSLDDFLGGDDADTDAHGDTDTDAHGDTDTDAHGDTDTDAHGDTDTDAHGDTDTADTAAERPRATYRWSPVGDDCPACGTTVQRRWREGDRFVCADCKEW
jgi:hypothetical protein